MTRKRRKRVVVDPPPGYQSPDGFHMHKCPECKTVWEHSDDCGGVEGAHNCPKPGCRGMSFWRYPILDPDPQEACVQKMGPCAP